MKRTACAAIAALLLGIPAVVCAATGATTQSDKSDSPQEIRRLLIKFDEAQATAPFRYPTACVAGTAEEYTEMALRAGLQGADGVQLHLWTVPEHFGRMDHADPDRKSGRCDYRVTSAGDPQGTHFIADFYSRKRPRTGEIAYAEVWQQGGHEAVLIGFPNGPRGLNPDITFRAVPVGTQPRGTP